MITDAAVRLTLPASDYERAKRFWGEQLGFTAGEEDPGGIEYKAGQGTGFYVFPSSGKASGDHTQGAFEVSDLDATIADLRSRGVTFEEYDTPELKTENGIATQGDFRGAWFKDSEGNMIGVVEQRG
jgi:predicted enzyme related to lactoylglutathione lyase